MNSCRFSSDVSDSSNDASSDTNPAISRLAKFTWHTFTRIVPSTFRSNTTSFASSFWINPSTFLIISASRLVVTAMEVPVFLNFFTFTMVPSLIFTSASLTMPYATGSLCYSCPRAAAMNTLDFFLSSPMRSQNFSASTVSSFDIFQLKKKRTRRTKLRGLVMILLPTVVYVHIDSPFTYKKIPYIQSVSLHMISQT